MTNSMTLKRMVAVDLPAETAKNVDAWNRQQQALQRQQQGIRAPPVNVGRMMKPLTHVE